MQRTMHFSTWTNYNKYEANTQIVGVDVTEKKRPILAVVLHHQNKCNKNSQVALSHASSKKLFYKCCYYTTLFHYVDKICINKSSKSH